MLRGDGYVEGDFERKTENTQFFSFEPMISISYTIPFFTHFKFKNKP